MFDFENIDLFQLDGFRKDKSCLKCPLFNRPFVGVDFPSILDNLEVLIVGEAAGEEEGKLGIPFVGRSGKLLRRILKAVGFAFPVRNFAITNVVKCCPENNETPSVGVIKRCGDLFLSKEVRSRKWKLIILCGGVAFKYFFPNLSFSAFKGSFIEKEGRMFLVVPHPASLFYKLPEEREEGARRLFNDFTRASFYVEDKGECFDKHYRIVSLDEFVGLIDDLGSIVSFDYETDKVEFWDNIRVKCFAVSDKEGYSYGVIVNEEEVGRLKEVLPLLWKGRKIVAHNAVFEAGVSLALDIDVSDMKIIDTMVMLYLWNELRGGYGLKEAVYDCLGLGYDYRVDAVSEKDLKKLSYYCCEDADYTLRLYYWLKEQLVSRDCDFLLEEVIGNAVFPVAQMMLNGVEVDIKYVEELGKDLESKLQSISDWAKSNVGDINLNSSIQVAEFLFKVRGYKVESSWVSNKTGRPSVDYSILMKLKERVGKDDFLNKLLEYRNIQKLYSTYVSGILKRVKNGKVHPRYSFVITVTGRLASSDINIQNQPRGSLIRKIFISSDNSRGLCEIDFNQIELRIIACQARDKKMLEIFEKNGDIHSATASWVLGIENPDSGARQSAKPVNFGLVYGMTDEGLRVYAEEEYGVVFSSEETRKFSNRFFLVYKDIKSYHQDVETFVRSHLYIDSAFGRRRNLPEILSDKPWEVSHALNSAYNAPIQSVASDINLFAMGKLYRRCKNIKFVATVHDNMLIECRKEDIPSIVEVLREEVGKLNNLFEWAVIPFTFKVKWGRSWGEMEEVKIGD